MCFSLFVVVQRSLNTKLESPITDARHAVGDGDGGQTTTAFESPATDARHAVGDGDGCQAAAASESRTADARHAVGDGDGCQAAAIVVFTTYCLPNCCDLNGRKVMTWILWTERMMKI